MNMHEFASVQAFCLTQPYSYEDFPFGPDIYVYKTNGKIFALLYQKDGVNCLNLKAEPTEALMLRQLFAAVIPGYHMNKKHWNTVLLDGSVPDNEIKRMIEQSWTLVQPKRRRPPAIMPD